MPVVWLMRLFFVIKFSWKLKFCTFFLTCFGRKSIIFDEMQTTFLSASVNERWNITTVTLFVTFQKVSSFTRELKIWKKNHKASSEGDEKRSWVCAFTAVARLRPWWNLYFWKKLSLLWVSSNAVTIRRTNGTSCSMFSFGHWRI